MFSEPRPGPECPMLQACLPVFPIAFVPSASHKLEVRSRAVLSISGAILCFNVADAIGPEFLVLFYFNSFKLGKKTPILN